MRIRTSLVLLQVCLTGALAAQADRAPKPIPAIAFTDKGVVVSGITPNGKVVWMEVARELEDMSLRLVRKDDIVVDTDGDGSVSVDLAQAVPEQSVWVAVDLTSGAFATNAPSGFPLHAVVLPLSALRPGAAGGADLLELARRQLELLVVRPGGTGSGAWGGTYGDGGPGDVDGAGDGRLQIALDSLEPLGDTTGAAAPVLRRNDLIVAVDTISLDLYAVRLAVSR